MLWRKVTHDRAAARPSLEPSRETGKGLASGGLQPACWLEEKSGHLPTSKGGSAAHARAPWASVSHLDLEGFKLEGL